MKKMTAQVNFCLFLDVFSVWPAIRCLKIGTFVLVKVSLAYLSIATLLFTGIPLFIRARGSWSYNLVADIKHLELTKD